MRAVLDTNVLISALLWRGAPYECLVAAQANWYELVSAEDIFAELGEKLIHKFQHSEEEAQDVIQHVRRTAIVVKLQGASGWVSRDPDDDKFIEAALVSGAEWIVSGDRHRLDLGTVETVRIAAPRQFLEFLRRQE